MIRPSMYQKHHLTQEANQAKEKPDSKAVRSLRNWGYDAQKE